MCKRIQTILATAGMFGGLLVGSAHAQTNDGKMSDSKMSDDAMPGKKMSHQQMMDKMNAMSADDKAAMFDKMTDKDKMSAMKMGGHDMGKMSSSDKMDMMGKMSSHDKADMFDKMPMQKKMMMMQGGSMMNSKPMDK